jgi:hypothetical protein
VGYALVVPLELVFGAILGFVPASLIKPVFSAIGMPAAVWRIAWIPVWVVSGFGVLLLLARGNLDSIATVRLLRGRFRPPDDRL